MEVTILRTRQVLATILVGLLPGAFYYWGELYVSGYTRNSDGSRDVGHMEKLLSPPAITMMLILLGVLTIGAGLIALGIARATGRLTAVRLITIAACLGAIAPLAFTVPSALSGSVSWGLFPVPTLAAALVAILLSGMFSLVAGLPLRARVPASSPTSGSSRAQTIVLIAAAALTIAILGWLVFLYAWALAHPCSGCFG